MSDRQQQIREMSDRQGDQYGNQDGWSTLSSSHLPTSSTSTQHDDHGDGSSSSSLPAPLTHLQDLWPQGSSEVHRRKFPAVEPDNDPLGLRQERRMERQKPLYDLPCLPDPWDDPLGVWKETSPGTYEIPFTRTSDGYFPRLVNDEKARECAEYYYDLQKNHPELIKQRAQFGPVEDIMYYCPRRSDYPTDGAYFKEIHNRLGIELPNFHESTSPPRDNISCEICYRNHWHMGCPYRKSLPTGACFNESFCYIVCECGQDFSEKGPCPESCRLNKFVMDYQLKALAKRTADLSQGPEET